ncbi:hypothetical protein [Xanthomonas nasturtii]|uniref:hypothetical protein n=1 Tax=Xanthomonas nasturtii TaxID=1843581 RepID=UPI0020114533|nr:hypothetical protein [Xanthomonas nasturtii]MCL1499737.1 hypothetical protein [Xanthomonas nasturtii]MCL1503429.1 hypothetical protein [Xanthomonas nasturtii]MCL1521500.1 hypothetical protein [Xanthomonas nasturtii]
MTRLLSSRVAAALLLAALSPTCVQAGEMTTPGEKSQFYSALAVSVPVVVGSAIVASPFVASSTAVDAMRNGSGQPRTGTLPPMRVDAVQTLPAGEREVRLQDPQQSEATVMLRWPARQDDPAAGFRVGDMVSFQPSPAGSGWTVHAPQGQALAFLPTSDAAVYNSSRSW